MVAVGGINIPINLQGIQQFNNQMNTIKNSIQGLRNPLANVQQVASQAIFQTTLNTLNLGAAFTGLTNPLKGANAGLLKTGIIGVTAISAILPLVANLSTGFRGLTTLQQIFTPITSNALLLQQITNKYNAGGLTFYGRYTDYVNLAGIIKEISAIAPRGGLLNLGLDVISRPAKVARELTGLIAVAQLTATAFTQIKTAAAGIQLDILNSAGSLVSGGGFLAPGQVAPGATAYTMFDPRQAIESRIGFEQLTEPLQNIQKLSGQSSSEISNFENDLLTLSLTSRQTILDLSASSKAMLMQGKSASESKNDLKDLAVIALGTSVNLQELTNSTLDIQQAFKDLSSKEIASSLSIVSTQTGTAISQYSNAIKNLNPTIKESGQGLNDLLVILGQLSNAGFEGEEAGNKLNLLFQSLNSLASGNAPKASQMGLQQLGINPDELLDSQGKLKSILDISSLLRERVASFSASNGSAESQGILSAIFGRYTAPVVNSLLQSTDDEILKLKNSISGSNGLTKTLAESRGETFTAQLQKISDSASIVSTKIGGVIIPVFQFMLAPIANVVSAFAELPSAVIAGALAFNLGLPAILLYVSGVRTYVSITKAAALVQTLWSGVLRLSTGELTINMLATKALAEAQKIGAMANIFLGGTYDLLSGKMSIATAKQNIFNAVTTFGDANFKSWISTTGAATTIMLKHAATMGLVVLAYNVFTELTRKSEGAKFADQLNKSTEEINKFNEQLNKTIPNTNSFKDYLSDLGQIASQKGWIEALRTGLGDLEGTLASSNGTLDTYGKGWGAFITGSQLGNQKAMIALDESLKSLHNQLNIGYDLLTKYGNGTKLTATESEAYKEEIGKQVESLKKYKESLEKVKAPTEEQQLLQQANIKLVDKQIAILQGRVKGLNEEGNTIKNIVVPSYDELIGKYDELNRKGKLKDTNQQITIEQSLVSGDISSNEAQQKKYLAEQQRINDEISRTNALKKDLQASVTGSLDDERVKIQNELNTQIQKEADLKLELIKNQGNINQFNQQNDIEKARVGILKSQSDEKLNQLKLEQDIAQGKLKGNDIERERGALQLANLQAQLIANEQAQSMLKGKKGETINTEKDKLIAENIDIQTQIAQFQIQENDKVAQLKLENEQKLKENKLKSIEEQFRKEQDAQNQLISKSEIKSTKNDFKLNEMKAQESLYESLANLDKQRLGFQLEIANRSQNSTQSEQIKLKIYQQQQQQLAQQKLQQQYSLSLGKEQQQLDLERKKLSSDLAILEAQANLDKAKGSGASESEIASLESQITIRQSQRDLIDSEAQSIDKINALENKRIGYENQIKTEQIEQQRLLDLQDIAVSKINESLEYQKSLNDINISKLDLVNKSYDNQSKIIESQQSLIQSGANLEKQKLDFQLELANRSGDVAKTEQLKAGIYLQQREEIIRQNEAQKISFELSQKQQEIELQKQYYQAQSAALEAQGNVSKAQALGVSGQQLTILEQQANLAQGQLDSIKNQFDATAKVNQNEAQRIGLENQIKLEQIEQQRQLELQDLAVQKINQSFEKQKGELESINTQMDLNNSELDRQSSLLNATSGLNDATSNLEKQRLEYQLELADISDDEVQKQQLKQQLYQQEIQSLLQRQAIERETLKINQQKQDIDIKRQETLAEIATLEAQAEIEKAKARGAGSNELESLNKVLALRMQQEVEVQKDKANVAQIQQLDNQKLAVEQTASREGLQNKQTVEQLRLAKENQQNSAKDGNSNGNIPNINIPPINVNVPPIKDTTDKAKLTESLATNELKINAQNVYLSGQVADSPNPKVNPNIPNNPDEQKKLEAVTKITPTPTPTEDPKERLRLANAAMDDYIAKFNNDAEKERIASGISAETATAGGFEQARIAREQAAKIEADLASGKLKTSGVDGFKPQQIQTPLQKLQSELNAAQKAVDSSKKQPVKTDNNNNGMQAETINNIDNLVIVSSDPTGDARQVLNDLAKNKGRC